MLRKPFFLLWAIHLLTCFQEIKAQCSAPPAPPASSFTDPVIAEGETLNAGITKWYKSSGTINNLTINGGTFIVDGNLTINNLTIESGDIYIRPGASLKVNGYVILKSNSKIFNYGTFNVDLHIYMLGPSTPATPNCIVNATPSAIISTPANYLYIGDPNSTFINNGIAEFSAIQTTSSAASGSVILNEGSETRLQSIYNSKENAWDVPGSACVSVSSVSSISQKITSSPNLKLALGNAHSCNSCMATPYGGAQVFSGAPSCGSVVTLPIKLSSFKIIQNNTCNLLTWQTNVSSEQLYFSIERSTNGINFQELSRLNNSNTMQYQLKDCSPASGINYYRIKIVNKNTNAFTYSEIVYNRNNTNATNGSTYPNPFINQFTLTLPVPLSTKIEGVLRNSLGQQIAIKLHKQSNALSVHTHENLKPGVYFFQLSLEDATYKYRLVKK